MTSITVDFGDGTAISYVNISSIEDGVKHIYGKVGIYQVSATASNNLGLDRVVLYLHVSCEFRQQVMWSMLKHANSSRMVSVSERSWLCIFFFSL